MRNLRKLFFVGVLGAVAAVVACGEDDGLVRTRPDGGTGDAAVDAAGEGGVLACGVPIPTTYVSPNFATNAAAELALKANIVAMVKKMAAAEATPQTLASATDLSALYNAGAPSLRSVANAYAQTTVDNLIAQFADAQARTWMPSDVGADAGASDAGAPTGGRYAGAGIYSAVGLDLREVIEKFLFDGALYNYALELQAGAITEATIDSFVALFGATAKLADSTSPDAGADADQLIAAYASMRDNKLLVAPGPYRKIASALRVAKAAASGGLLCRGDLDAALKIFFLEWEKTAYLSAIFFLNQASTNATAMPQQGEPALRGFGAAIGFAMSFRGIPQDRRKITDAQIDTLLTHIGASTPYQLVTTPNDRAVAFNGAFNDIGAVYGLTPTEIEDAKKSF